MELKALVKEIIADHDENTAIALFQDYNTYLVKKEEAYGVYLYDGYKEDFPDGILYGEVADVENDARRQLVSHRVTKISLDNSKGDAIVKMTVELCNTKAGHIIGDMLSSKDYKGDLRLVSNIQPKVEEDGVVRLRIVSFNFVKVAD